MMNIRLNPFYSPVPSGGGQPVPVEEPAEPAEPATTSHGNKPLTRKEIIQAGGELTPLTREEVYLKKQMEQSGGGGLPDTTNAPLGAWLTVKNKSGGGKEAAWSNTAMYQPSASDIGLVLGVVDDGEGNAEYDVVEIEPFIVHFDYDESHNLFAREPWSEIVTHGRNVVAFYDGIYVPLCEYSKGIEGEITFRLFVPTAFNDSNMTYSTPAYYRLGVADGAVWGGKYTEAGK